MTLSELDAANPPDEVEVEDEFDTEDYDTAVNMLHDCTELLDHIQKLDKEHKYLTRNRRIALSGLLDELYQFLELGG